MKWWEDKSPVTIQGGKRSSAQVKWISQLEKE